MSFYRIPSSKSSLSGGDGEKSTFRACDRVHLDAHPRVSAHKNYRARDGRGDRVRQNDHRSGRDDDGGHHHGRDRGHRQVSLRSKFEVLEPR